MRIAHSLIAVALGLVAATGMAQTRQDIERCRSLSADARRLSCYDGIELAPGPLQRGKYETVRLTELKLDPLSFRGRSVEVTGWLIPGADLFQLGTDSGDLRPVPVDIRSLERRARDAFLDLCGGGCDATVQGRVGPVGFTTGIAADSLIALGTLSRSNLE